MVSPHQRKIQHTPIIYVIDSTQVNETPQSEDERKQWQCTNNCEWLNNIDAELTICLDVYLCKTCYISSIMIEIFRCMIEL